MLLQSSNPWMWLIEKTPDTYFAIVILSALIVVTHAFMIFHRIRKHRSMYKDTKAWIKWTILGSALLLIGMMLGNTIYRLEVFNGIPPYYTTFLWKYNLFTSFTMMVTIFLWVIKGIVIHQWFEWRKDLFNWKITKYVWTKWFNKADLVEKYANQIIITDSLLATVVMPMSGSVNSLSSLNDGVFSKNTVGEGVAITMPKDGVVLSPISGTVSAAFPTKHAYGITNDEGVEILIHIGIDTVALQGDGFASDIKQGQKIKVGDVLAKVDVQMLKDKNIKSDIIILNTLTSAGKISAIIPSGDKLENEVLFNIVKG